MISTIILTISSGSVVSNIADCRNGRGLFTLVANALTSCQLFLQCGTQASSASFRRVDVAAPTGSTAAWVWGVGSGDRAIGLPSAVGFLRVETSVAQADNRSLGLIVGGL
jgi:hypothetical protein